MNCINLIGRIVRDPELRYSANTNTAVAKFSLAVPRKFKKDGEGNVDFINIVAWSKTAEFVTKYFSKGQQVAITGRIETRHYENEQGQRVNVFEVVAESVYFADSKRENEAKGESYTNKTPEEKEEIYKELEDEGLPF